MPRGTLILPTYNAATFIDGTARRLIRFADDHPDWRVMFVCDGCTDGTVAKLQALLADGDGGGRIRIESYGANRGKGYALRRGLDLADTPFKVYTDVDLAYDPSEAVRLADVLKQTSADLAVVNRACPQSQFIITPRDFHNIYKRHLMSRTFNWWLRRMLPINALDTQAGLKAITAEAWDRLRDRVRSDGFFFDVDLLAWAGAMEMRVAQMPVVFRYFDPTTVRMVKHGSSMILSTFALRRRLNRAARRERYRTLRRRDGKPPRAHRRKPRLFVTADDFGFGVATSEGIIDAHLHGPVTRTSMMVVTGDHVRRSVPLLERAPDLQVGLHLVLTDCGHPALAAKRCSGLLRRDGRLLPLWLLWMRAIGRRIDRQAVVDEIAAQVEMFERLLGRRPAHVDGHHHAHQLPVIRDAVAEAIAAGILPNTARVTVEPPGARKHVSGERLRRRIANQLGAAARECFAGSGVHTNEYFFGMLGAAELAKPFPWEPYLPHLPDGRRVEWVVHPGRTDLTLRGRDTYLTSRAAELDALTDPRHRQLWEPLVVDEATPPPHFAPPAAEAVPSIAE